MEEKTNTPTPTINKSAGKGDKPRNISRKFWDNYDEIDWKKDGRPFKITVKIDENTTGEL